MGRRVWRIKALILSAAVVAAGSSAVWAAQPPDPGQPPVFVGTPYAMVCDVSPPGNQVFSFSGSAVDPDVGDIINISGSGSAPYLQFETMDGNPASFTLKVLEAGLPPGARGTFGETLLAFSGTGDRFLVASTSITVTIVPEPCVLAAIVGVGFIVVRRRVAQRG